MEQETEEISYFFDSYAIIEILEQNPAYENYKYKPVIITIFNLAEIYLSCLNKFNEEELNKIYNEYKESVVEIPDDVLKEAMKFKKANKKKRLSYADCIGYVYALKNNMKFLTGDKEFNGLKNVEFVK